MPEYVLREVLKQGFTSRNYIHSFLLSQILHGMLFKLHPFKVKDGPWLY
jgi:hypothetical protein